jgi:hypothetical protein
MPEILSFPEGSAQFATGDGSFQTQVFVRDVRLMPTRDTHRYRVPQKAGFAHINLLRTNATLSFGMAESPAAQLLKAWMYGATPGTLHGHFFALSPGINTSGGFFAYSGTIDNGEYGGTDGDAEQRFAVNGWFETWSAY